jgi:hypothetical protein
MWASFRKKMIEDAMIPTFLQYEIADFFKHVHESKNQPSLRVAIGRSGWWLGASDVEAGKCELP